MNSIIINNYRSGVNLDTEIQSLRLEFEKITDTRAKNVSHKLSDLLMSGFAMFALKHPSLLSFESMTMEEKANLETVFGIQNVPSDTQLRDVLDGINPIFFARFMAKKIQRIRAFRYCLRF